MQVVAVTPLYPPGSRVGAWLATHEALRHLHGRGHSVSVLRYLTHGPSYVHEGVHVTGAASIEQDVSRADVVIAHLGDDGRAQHLARRHGKPLVRMVHGWCPDAQERLRGCDLAVFNSEAARTEFGNGEKSIVVHPVTREAEHRTVPGDRITLVNLSPVKGGELFRLLAISLPALSFLGVRGGWGRQESHMMPKNVEVLRMTDRMREDVWARTRVLLMPSDRETWGMVGVEALASGIPVIAADRPGLRESLSSGAFTFLEPADLTGWQKAVEDLQEPDVWSFASLRARARFEELQDGFTAGLDRFAEEVEALCAS